MKRNILLSILIFASACPYILTAKSPKKESKKEAEPLYFGEVLNLDEFTSIKVGNNNPDDLLYKVLVKGTGNKPKRGETVTVHYTLHLADRHRSNNTKAIVSSKCDSSLTRGKAFSFRLGAGQVIKGWDLAIPELAIGTKAILVMKPNLGYGANTNGTIPGGSTLIFEVEILAAQ